MVDALCYDDLDPNGTELNDPVAELEQDLYHRLIEPPGSNIDDPDRGLGIHQMMNAPTDPSWQGRIEAEFLKDDRVQAVSVQMTEIDDGNGGTDVRIDIAIEPEGDIAVLLDSSAGTVTQVPT